MGEATTIGPERDPLTLNTLVEAFRGVGLVSGQTVLAHASLSSLGWVAGGAQVVLQALLTVLTPTGTLMMPTHTGHNTDPAHWANPPVPDTWWATIRENMPPYDPALTPSYAVGRVAELFRTFPGVKRSQHPIGSFAALGAQANFLLTDHRLESIFGENSPLARLYELRGWVLLIGVGHAANTSLHLAEYRADYPGKRTRTEGCAMTINGRRRWVTHETLALHTEDFPVLGAAFETAHGLPIHPVAAAEVRFMPVRPLVDFAVDWMTRHRDFSTG
ncbi:MAG: AAC(3) family N-acetyltransferase [Anaerolineae bacterium]|nr:AAC(3) family N-acetyltransferase [Anaerolineae bacterium]